MPRNTQPEERKGFQTTIVSENNAKKISLNALKELRITRTVTNFSVIRDLDANTIVSKVIIGNSEKSEIFPLIEIQMEDIATYRRDGNPALLVKFYGKYYYTQIPRGISFLGINILGTHKCAAVGHECAKLSALHDEEGGCQKVRDLAEEKALEKYDMILVGYETLNTPTYQAFVVIECNQYQKFNYRAPSYRDTILAKESLKDYYED